LPLVAKIMIVDGPTAAESATANVMDSLAPASTEKLAPGMAITPAGIPCNEILIVPANPFCALVDIKMDEVVFPTTADVESGETETLKSPTGGGGPCWLLPHPAATVIEVANSNDQRLPPFTLPHREAHTTLSSAHLPRSITDTRLPPFLESPESMHGDRDVARVLQRSRGCRNRNREVLRWWGIAATTTSSGQTQSQ